MKERYYRQYKAEAMEKEAEKTADYTTRKQICYILSTCDYIAALVSITSLYFVMSGIQYWITDYIVTVL